MSESTQKTHVIDGKAVAAALRREVAAAAADFQAQHGRAPTLTTILVGDDPASKVYVAGKHRACAEVGISSNDERLPADTSQDYLAGLIKDLGDDEAVDGILLQLPLPDGLDETALTELIAPEKDVDGLTSVNAGRLVQNLPGIVPCTPQGVIRLLEESAVEFSGADAVVIGRSNLVGRPVASLLLARDATVTTCHSRTTDLAERLRRADIVVSCVGVPGLVRGEMIKPGAAVVDVGIVRTDDGITGDVERASVEGVAGVLTPVPGGVGPMTIACLLENTVKAAQRRAGE